MPNDAWFEELDPVMRTYLFEHWIEDENEKRELLRMCAILTGSFFNPEAAREMVGAKTQTLDEEDFERSLDMVRQDRQKHEEQTLHRRKPIAKPSL